MYFVEIELSVIIKLSMIACCIAYGVTVSYFMNDYAMVMRCGMPRYSLALLDLVVRCIADVVTVQCVMRH